MLGEITGKPSALLARGLAAAIAAMEASKTKVRIS